jgi:hypothetical protein
MFSLTHMKSNLQLLFRVFSAVAAYVFIYGAHAQLVTANLLYNPGAETGDLTGWTIGGDSNPFAGSPDNSLGDGFSTHSGNNYFVGGTGSFGSLSQVVTLVGNQGITAAMLDKGNLLASVSFWEQGLNQGTTNDEANISLTFFNAANSVLRSVSTPVIDSLGNSWLNYTNQYPIPPFARAVRYTMNFYRNAGNDLDAFIDDNSLVVVEDLRAPTNDNFAEATQITGFSNYLSGSTINATSEPEEPGDAASVWWVFKAPTNGTVSIENGQRFFPYLQVYRGDTLVNLKPVASSHTLSIPRCTFGFDVQGGGIYYIKASDFFEDAFTFKFVFQAAPPNDAFVSRQVLAPDVQRVTGTTIGATREAGDPALGSNSVWWSWTPTHSGPVILTTTGSEFDTTLAVYTGTALANLSLVASNDTAYIWGGTNGPQSDPASRLRLEAVAGRSYKIEVAGGAGDVVLNIERLAIETITPISRTVQPDRSVVFTTDLLLSNMRGIGSGSLRVRLIARPWYLSLDGVFWPCPEDRPAFDAPDSVLGLFPLPAPGSIGSSNSTHISVNGTVPPPHEDISWGYGYGVLAVLEEEADGIWIPSDSRMIALGDWPALEGFNGPGGGVILLVPTQSAGTALGYLQVHVGPAAARQAGAGWRLQGETSYRTNPNSTALITTNGPIKVEFSSVPGWSPPLGQVVQLSLGVLTVVDANYTVMHPTMSANAALGIGLTGTTNTTYRIEYRTNLVSGAWQPLQTNTLHAGFNLVLPIPKPSNRSAAFYRAVWLP